MPVESEHQNYVSALVYITRYQIDFFFQHWRAFLRRPSVLSRSSGCGALRRLVKFTTHVWAPAELRGMCCARLIVTELAHFHGNAFRRAEPRRNNKNPQKQKNAGILSTTVHVSRRP